MRLVLLAAMRLPPPAFLRLPWPLLTKSPQPSSSAIFPLSSVSSVSEVSEMLYSGGEFCRSSTSS